MRAAAYLRSRVLDSQLLEWWLVYEVHICWAVTGMMINIGVWISYLTQAPYGRTRPCAPTFTGVSLPPPLAFECVRVVSAGGKCTNVPHAGRGRLGLNLVSAAATRCLGACWRSLAYQPYILGAGWQYVTAH